MIKTASCALLVLTLFTAATSAQEPPPRQYEMTPGARRPASGLGGIIVGWAGLGVGAGALATIPLCYASFYPEQARTGCMVGQAIIGGGAWVASAIGFVVGYRRRAVYREWRAAQQTARLGSGFTSGPVTAGLGYRLVF